MILGKRKSFQSLMIHKFSNRMYHIRTLKAKDRFTLLTKLPFLKFFSTSLTLLVIFSFFSTSLTNILFLLCQLLQVNKMMIEFLLTFGIMLARITLITWELVTACITHQLPDLATRKTLRFFLFLFDTSTIVRLKAILFIGYWWISTPVLGIHNRLLLTL